MCQAAIRAGWSRSTSANHVIVQRLSVDVDGTSQGPSPARTYFMRIIALMTIADY